MTEACSNCRFWDVYAEGNGPLVNKIGDCRRRPPVISSAILTETLPRGRQLEMAHYEIEIDLSEATVFPISRPGDWCGEYEAKPSGVPL